MLSLLFDFDAAAAAAAVDGKDAKRPSLKAFSIVRKLLALKMVLFSFLLTKFAHMLTSWLSDLINTSLNRASMNRRLQFKCIQTCR